MEEPYRVSGADLATLILRKFYPERTDRESTVIRDFLAEHLHEFDSVSFSVRVGQGQSPDPTHLPGVQRATVFSSQKRIDILGRQGSSTTIIEVKERVTPAALGQILTYRHLFLEDNPDAKEPRLVVVGRYADDDTIRVLQSHDVTVYLYETADGARAAQGSGV